MTFLEFVDRKDRESANHLEILRKVFEDGGIKVKSAHKGTDPYLYVINPYQDDYFGGIRVYVIGGIPAYRVQNREDTEPYGKSYQLNVEEMFNDLLSDHRDPDKAAKALAKDIVKSIKNFFKKSSAAAKEMSANDFGMSPSNPMNRVISRIDNGPDYGNLINNPRP